MHVEIARQSINNPECCNQTDNYLPKNFKLAGQPVTVTLCQLQVYFACSEVSKSCVFGVGVEVRFWGNSGHQISRPE